MNRRRCRIAEAARDREPVLTVHLRNPCAIVPLSLGNPLVFD